VEVREELLLAPVATRLASFTLPLALPPPHIVRVLSVRRIRGANLAVAATQSSSYCSCCRGEKTSYLFPPHKGAAPARSTYIELRLRALKKRNEANLHIYTQEKLHNLLANV
jgi:hypothetical protein